MAIVGTLVACASAPPASGVRLPPAPPPVVAPAPAEASSAKADDGASPGGSLVRGRARWTPVPWADLPGFEQDNLSEAWNAWLKSCERPAAPLAALCAEVRPLSIADGTTQRRWMQSRLQPYRVEALEGGAEGLLTAYYEPEFMASRERSAAFPVPLYRPPAGLGARRPWYTRQEIDTLPEAQAALRGREIAWLADPLDALMLQIQGSGRLRVREADGRERLVRLAFAATNDQPYKSVGRSLLDRGVVRDASWRGIRDWAARHPAEVQAVIWTNPRTVFFREEPLADFDAAFGPRGAQGVPLTPGRSIAVDAGSMPWGTPVWLASRGPVLSLQRLVLAQDTGSAITGAVRADYFAGWGEQAGDIAGRLKQSLRLWVLWPR